MKSNSDVRPPIIQDLGDGSYYYNYNIKEVEVEDEDGATKTAYEYDTVHIWGIPNYAKCVKAVLRDRRDETEEFNLINKYNAFALGVSEDIADRDNYEAYLLEVKRLKEMIQIDIDAYHAAGE